MFEFGFDSQRRVFGGDLWLLCLVVWVIVVVVLVVGGGFSFDWLLVVVSVRGYGFFVLRLILSGLVNWVCLDLKKNMKNEVHVLGLRFLGLTFFYVGFLMWVWVR